VSNLLTPLVRGGLTAPAERNYAPHTLSYLTNMQLSAEFLSVPSTRHQHQGRCLLPCCCCCMTAAYCPFVQVGGGACCSSTGACQALAALPIRNNGLRLLPQQRHLRPTAAAAVGRGSSAVACREGFCARLWSGGACHRQCTSSICCCTQQHHQQQQQQQYFELGWIGSDSRHVSST
jgi:hypothetical protein